MKSVAEAEAKAEELRADAEEKAAAILASAEEEAAQIARECEAGIKNMREEKLRLCTEKSQADYARALGDEATRRKGEADALIEGLDREVSSVVGRITVGNR